MRVIQTKQPLPVHGLSFSANGRSLAVAGRDEILIHSIMDEPNVSIPVVSFYHCRSLCWNPSGSRLFVDANSTRCYDLTTVPPKPLTSFDITGESTHLFDFALSRDGRYLVGSQDGPGKNALILWQLDETNAVSRLWRVLAESNTMDGSTTAPVAFGGATYFAPCISGNKMRIANGLCDFVYRGSHDPLPIQIRNLQDGSVLCQFDVPTSFPGLVRLQFTPSSELLVVVQRQSVTFHGVTDGRIVHELKYPGRAYLTGLQYHPSGKFFITVGGDRLVRYWDAKTFEITKTLKWDIGKLTCLDISPDGTLAAAGDEKGKVILWDVDT